MRCIYAHDIPVYTHLLTLGNRWLLFLQQKEKHYALCDITYETRLRIFMRVTISINRLSLRFAEPFLFWRGFIAVNSQNAMKNK